MGQPRHDGLEPEPADGRRPFLASRLAEDQDLLAEVETAEKLGISLKRFRGWETTTFHEHRGGRLVASVPEVEWDEEQQGWMLALRMYRASRCPGCGGDLNITAAAENEEKFKRMPPVECFRCLEFARSVKAYSEQEHSHVLLHQVPQRPTG